MILRNANLQRGLTLMEILVASVILAVSVLGFASIWLFTIKSSIDLDSHAAATECARSVLERAHSIGFFAQGYQPATNSAPASEPIETFRFFDTTLAELGASNAPSMPSLPPTTAYVAMTQITWIQWATGDPIYRNDQNQMMITVTVQQVNAQGMLTAPLVTLQSILTEGGL